MSYMSVDVPLGTERQNIMNKIVHLHWLYQLKAKKKKSWKEATLLVEMCKLLTNLRRKVFSRSAPMHPANPKMNITPPTTRKSQTGSKPPKSVIDEMLDSTPWGQKNKTNNKLQMDPADFSWLFPLKTHSDQTQTNWCSAFTSRRD